jgi:hypothetical protein
MERIAERCLLDISDEELLLGCKHLANSVPVTNGLA